MIRRGLLLFVAAITMGCELHGGVWSDIVDKFRGQTRPAPPQIRVLVAHDINKVGLEVTDKYSLYDPYTNSHISSRLIGKSREIQAMSDGLKWGEAFPGLYQLKIKPDEPGTVAIIEGRQYPGSIYVYDIGGTISLVNQVLVEDYVRSTLSSFNPDNLHPEVLAAIAIAARTNAYFQASNPKNTYWAVDAQKVGYYGLVPMPQESHTAVDLTKYMIISQTGVYEGMATPFPVKFGPVVPTTGGNEAVSSKLTMEEANELAQKGDHAAQILGKAFPGTTIMLMHYSS